MAYDFELKIIAGLLQDFLKSVKIIDGIALVTVSGNSLSTSVVDPAHIACGTIVLKDERGGHSSEVQPSSDYAIGLNIERTLAAVKNCEYGDKVTLYVDSDRCKIKAGHLTSRFRLEEGVSTYKADHKVPGNAECTLDQKNLKQFLDSTDGEDAMSILLDKDMVTLSAGEVLEDGRIYEYSIPKDECVSLKVPNGPVQASYPFDYMAPIVKLAKDSTVTMRLGNDLPISISPNIHNHSINVEATYLIAPRIVN